MQTVGCSCLNEKVAGNVRVTLSLCPGSQKGTGQQDIGITSRRTGREQATTQRGSVQFAEPITLSGLSEADRVLSQNLTFLFAQVLAGPPLQFMMNVGRQNGLEAWRLLVRSEHPMTGANMIAVKQAILQFQVLSLL